MQVIRTIVLVFVILVLGVFSFANWEPVTVKLWENVFLETKLPALILVSFLIGVVPMYLIHRADRWRLNRRISSLENSVRAAAAAPPLATSTQLEQHADQEKPLP